jgi:hypothetical protein
MNLVSVLLPMGGVAMMSLTPLLVQLNQDMGMPEKVVALHTWIVPEVQELRGITPPVGRRAVQKAQIMLAEVIKVQAMVPEVLISLSQLKPRIFQIILAQGIRVRTCPMLDKLVQLRVLITERGSKSIRHGRHKIMHM